MGVVVDVEQCPLPAETVRSGLYRVSNRFLLAYTSIHHRSTFGESGRMGLSIFSFPFYVEKGNKLF
jgi:hypothetical protein